MCRISPESPPEPQVCFSQHNMFVVCMCAVVPYVRLCRFIKMPLSHRKSMWWLHQSELCTSCPGHSAGEGSCKEAWPGPANAWGFLLLFSQWGDTGSQRSNIRQHGCRWVKFTLHFQLKLAWIMTKLECWFWLRSKLYGGSGPWSAYWVPRLRGRGVLPLDKSTLPNSNLFPCLVINTWSHLSECLDWI